MRHGLTALSMGLLLAAGAVLHASSTVVTFTRGRPGTLPEPFRALTSVPGEPGRWQIARDGDTAVLAQTMLGRRGYRLAVLDGVRIADVHVGVRLKLGDGDKAAGLAWRVQDEGTYFAARLDLDDHEIVLYKFVRGNRVRLDRLTGLRLEARRWHELIVEHQGARVRVWLNGIPVLAETDEGTVTAGTVGFWMPGDGTAAFERIWYRPLDNERR